MKAGFTKRNVAALMIVASVVKRAVEKTMPDDELAKIEDPERFQRSVANATLSTLAEKGGQDA